jgi:hypothetical protein
MISASQPPGRLGLIFARLAPAFKREVDAIGLIDRLLQAPHVTASERVPLHFAAAGLLDRLNRFDEAFLHARLGNEGSRRDYKSSHHSAQMQHRIDYYTPAKLHDLPRASHGNRRPVFIVGMIRSGTSLIEQILASHPQVYGGGELNFLSRIANSAARAAWTEGEIYPEFLDTISLRRANHLAESYLSSIAALNATAAYVTDKMPHNFLYLGLIALLFPDCHIIHCMRDARDTCLSCYTTYFAAAHDYTHDLTDLASFWKDYRRFMAHWKTTLNFPMLEINYEDVVADLEGQTRRLLEFLDLPWDERCLNFHLNTRTVATASADQIRKRLYASSVGRWKHYESHLGPLLAALPQQAFA